MWVSLTFLQPFISLFLVCHQGSRRSQVLLAEHLIALPGGPQEDDPRQQQHAAHHADQPPHSESPLQFCEQNLGRNKASKQPRGWMKEMGFKKGRMRRWSVLQPVYPWPAEEDLVDFFYLKAEGKVDLMHDILEVVQYILYADSPRWAHEKGREERSGCLLLRHRQLLDSDRAIVNF